MSNAVLPVLPGLTWGVKMRPKFETQIQIAKSGKETRAQFQAYPLWEFDLSHEFLRQQIGIAELQQLVGFFLARQGRFDSFLYNNPLDNAVTTQQFGVGDASTTAFQLVRAFGGFLEPVQNLNGAPSIYRNDWQGNQLMYAMPRTNTILWSEAFDNAAWGAFGVTVTADAVASPDGTTTTDRMLETAATAEHYVNQGSVLPYANGTSVLLSVVASPQNGRNFLRLSLVQRDAVTVLGASFNVSTGAVVGTDGGVTSFTPVIMSNGAYRCSIRVGVGTGASAAQPRVQASSDGFTLVYLGDVTKGLNIWGANSLDATTITVPSGYIKSTTAAVTVTDYALNSTGLVTFASAPLLSAALTWTGNFYYRCRFLDDMSEFDNFLNQLWSNSKLGFVSVKL